MKKTCNRCKALLEDSFSGFTCSLGFPINIVTFENIYISAKPLSHCPKPLTYKRINELKYK
jgi:hypothetical protein